MGGTNMATMEEKLRIATETMRLYPKTRFKIKGAGSDGWDWKNGNTLVAWCDTGYTSFTFKRAAGKDWGFYGKHAVELAQRLNLEPTHARGDDADFQKCIEVLAQCTRRRVSNVAKTAKLFVWTLGGHEVAFSALDDTEVWFNGRPCFSETSFDGAKAQTLLSLHR